jgi:hypothetical protein
MPYDEHCFWVWMNQHAQKPQRAMHDMEGNVALLMTADIKPRGVGFLSVAQQRDPRPVFTQEDTLSRLGRVQARPEIQAGGKCDQDEG